MDRGASIQGERFRRKWKATSVTRKIVSAESKIEWLPYRPSNGTEGAMFFEQWCSRCAKDLPMSTGKDYDSCAPGETCSLIANSMAYKVTDPEYPKEWRRRADATEYPGAECTAFLPEGEPIPQRCTPTKELF